MPAALSPTTLLVIRHAEKKVRKGLRQLMEIDGWTDRQTGDERMDGLFVCLLVGCLGLNGPLGQYFREMEKEKRGGR